MLCASIEEEMVIESVEKEPSADIINWSIRAAKFSNNAESDHLLGFVPQKAGRVTSAIYNFDSETQKITTASGRIYTLIGPPGKSDDAEYIWQFWKLMNSVVNDIDVTESYAQQIKKLIM